MHNVISEHREHRVAITAVECLVVLFDVVELAHQVLRSGEGVEEFWRPGELLYMELIGFHNSLKWNNMSPTTTGALR